jgi:hypothetical protein
MEQSLDDLNKFNIYVIDSKQQKLIPKGDFENDIKDHYLVLIPKEYSSKSQIIEINDELLKKLDKYELKNQEIVYSQIYDTKIVTQNCVTFFQPCEKEEFLSSLKNRKTSLKTRGTWNKLTNPINRNCSQLYLQNVLKYLDLDIWIIIPQNDNYYLKQDEFYDILEIIVKNEILPISLIDDDHKLFIKSDILSNKSESTGIVRSIGSREDFYKYISDSDRMFVFENKSDKYCIRSYIDNFNEDKLLDLYFEFRGIIIDESVFITQRYPYEKSPLLESFTDLICAIDFNTILKNSEIIYKIFMLLCEEYSQYFNPKVFVIDILVIVKNYEIIGFKIIEIDTAINKIGTELINMDLISMELKKILI